MPTTNGQRTTPEPRRLPRTRHRLRRAAVGTVAAALTVGLAQLPSAGFAESGPSPAPRLATPGDPVAGLGDLDARGTARHAYR